MESPSTSRCHAVRSAKNLIERMIEGPIDERPHSFDQRHGEFLASQSSVREFSETVNWLPVFGTRFKDPEFTMGLISEPCNFFEQSSTHKPSRSRSHSHAQPRRSGSNSGQSSRPKQGRSRSYSDSNSHHHSHSHSQSHPLSGSRSLSHALSGSGESTSPPFGTFTVRDGSRLSTKVIDNFTSGILTMLLTDFRAISQDDTEASFELSGFDRTGTGSRLTFRVRKRVLESTSRHTPTRRAFTPLSEVDVSGYMADASDSEKQGGKWVLIDILAPAAKQQASAQPGENPFGTPEAVAVTTRSLYIPTAVTFTPR